MEEITADNKRSVMRTYAINIVLSCMLTMMLNVIHARFVVNIPLSAASFMMPVIAGVLFGFTLAKIKLLSNQLRYIAYTDSLTRIYNRLHFGNFLDAEIDKVQRYGGTCSVIYFDIDFFKVINDKHGHLVGDEILKALTEKVNDANRNSDVFARCGGEEFIILATSTDLEGATIHAERLRQMIEETDFDVVGRVTCSFGVAEFDKEHDDAKTFVRRADAALYNAKSHGRNRVVQSRV